MAAPRGAFFAHRPFLPRWPRAGAFFRRVLALSLATALSCDAGHVPAAFSARLGAFFGHRPFPRRRPRAGGFFCAPALVCFRGGAWRRAIAAALVCAVGREPEALLRRRVRLFLAASRGTALNSPSPFPAAPAMTRRLWLALSILWRVVFAHLVGHRIDS